MCLSVYLFKNKPIGPHEVDFARGNRGTVINLMFQKGEEGLSQKTTSKHNIITNH